MNRLLPVLFLAGCGALSSGSGTPPPVPSSGLGPSTPWSDDTGLSWTPPFVFADPAQALTHPSAIADGDAIDLWAESTRGSSMTSTIIHGRAASFETGFVDSEDVLAPSLPWHDALHAPSVVAIDDARWLLYLSSGQVGLCELTRMRCRETPLYTDPRGRVRSLAAARVDASLHVVVLVGESLFQLTIPSDALDAIVGNGAAPLTPTAIALDIPSWAIGFLDVGLRAEATATGRWREDLFYACALPATADLSATIPSAIGAASRYAGEASSADPPFSVVAEPILVGSPPPRAPTALGYQGGVLLLYAAQSGPRQAIAVARHP